MSVSKLLQEIIALGAVNGWPTGATIKTEEELMTSPNVGIFGKNITRLPDGLMYLARVRALGFQDNKLLSLPDTIIKLADLQYLSLHKNQISSLPVDIGELHRLQVLDVGENQLTALPHSITLLSNLVNLIIHFNKISYVPVGIGELRNLTSLDLGGNKLSSIPESVVMLTKLCALTLSTNELSSLPSGIDRLVNLMQLSLRDNKLSSLPNCLTNMTNITHLSLVGNQLSSLPEGFGQLVKLTQLALQSNKLSCLPESISKQTNLVLIDVQRNMLSSLPLGIGEIRNLQFLDANTNQLSSVPDSLTQLTKLKHFVLHTNKLLSLPGAIGQLLNLTGLILGSNKLSSVPDSVTAIKAMRVFSLPKNQLSSLPGGIGQIPNLETIDISNNQISSLPEGVQHLRNLIVLDISRNKFSVAPESITSITSLTFLNMGVNQLSSLPENIGMLSNLQILDMNWNQLSSIPQSISKLANLKDFCLISNQLSSLPEFIGALTNLATLSICQNPIVELPQSLTLLHKLKLLLIEWEGMISIKYAPVGLVELPCWSNQEIPWPKNMNMRPSESLKTLLLYSNHSHNNLTEIQSLIAKWKYCSRVDISRNKIRDIPEQLSTLRYLSEINMADNMLTSFPDVFLRMPWLKSLDISANAFTALPEGITNLTKLSVLVIAEPSGRVILQSVPAGISTLPCFESSTDLQRLSSPKKVETLQGVEDYILPEAPLIQQSEKLGEGGQASVYRGSYKGTAVAIKVLKPDSDEVEKAMEEVKLTKKIRHPNIIEILGVYHSEMTWIVLELASNSLKGYIESKGGPLEPIEIVSFGSQIAGALNFCITQYPSQPIHHRDLKTENILIVNGQAKVADFGLAETRTRTGVSSRASRTKIGGGEAGTQHWQGAEIYSTVCQGNTDTNEFGENVGHRGEASDVFAFGLILWSMATGKYPFKDIHSTQVTPAYTRGERPDIPSSVHPTLSQIIRSCWRQNYKLRPKFKKLVAILSMCGAGTLDEVTKEELNQTVPITYSPVQAMYLGELFQYLTEQGIPREIAMTLARSNMNGEIFASYSVPRFMERLQTTEAIAQALVSLQKLGPGLQKVDSQTGFVAYREGPYSPAPISPGSTAPQTLSTPIASPTNLAYSLNSANPYSAKDSPISLTSSLNKSGTYDSYQLPNLNDRPTPPKPLSCLSHEELITYLTGQKGITTTFMAGLKASLVDGEGFVTFLDQPTLMMPPFNMQGLQLTKTLEVIEELKKIA